MADYIIYKSGANTIARNTSTGTDQFTNTDARTVFNSALSTLNTAGSGGTVYVKRGTYTISSGDVTAYDNITMVGEDRDTTIIRSGDASTSPIKKTGVILTGFKLKNLTVDSPGLGSPIYFAGATRCILRDCRFAFTSMPASPKIMVWFDSLTGTRDCFYNKIIGNIFEGATNGQDTLGGGRMDWSVISGNTFIGPSGATGAGQAIGQSGCKYATYSYNTFRDYGNFIGMEGASGTPPVVPTYGCSFIGNTAYNCGKLKLSLVTSDNKSMFNTVIGNTMLYGNSGIEDGNGYGDVIVGNLIARTNITGIRGTFNRCVIADNNIVETNHQSSSSTAAGGVSHRLGGIVLEDNTSNVSNPRATKISGNKISRTGSSYTYEPDGTTKTGASGGILIGSSYTNVVVVDNMTDNITADPFQDHGSGTVNRTNDAVT